MGAEKIDPADVQKKRRDGAARLYAYAEELLRNNPRNPDALFIRAACLVRARDLRGAIADLETLAEVDETHAGLWVLKTKLHAMLGDAEKAEESRVRRLEVEKRQAEASQEQVSDGQRVPMPAPRITCPSCGLAVDEEDAVCLWCGVGLGSVQATLPWHPSPEPARVKTVAPPPAPEPETVETAARPPTASPSTGPRRPERASVGLTNGLGKEARGTGRTNGIAHATMGRTNGMTNGIAHATTGRTNGMTNGLASTVHALRAGMTNGLTNGSGFTNGLGSPQFQRQAAASRWKVYLIPIMAATILILPLFGPSTTTGRGPITIDGDASDWPSGLVHAQSPGGPNPNVDLTRFAVADNVDGLAILIEVAGIALRGGDAPPTMDAFHVFLDADGDAGTGYAVDGLGADRLVRLSGWGGGANVSAITTWDDAYDPTDWRGWRHTSVYAPTATAGGRIEAQVDWPHVGETRGRAFASVHARGFDGATDRADFVLNVAGGSVVVRQTPVVPATVTGGTVTLLRLEATSFREAARWSGVAVTLMGSAPFAATTQLRILDSSGGLVDVRTPVDRRVSFEFEAIIPAGETASFDVVADTIGSSGATLGALVGSARDIVAPGSAVTLVRGTATHDVGYLGAPPTDPRVDGGFDEWRATDPDPMGDVTRPYRPDVDVAAFGAQSRGNASYFFAEVAGRLFQGTWVVESNGLAVSAGIPIDADGDGVPDAVDPLPLDFNNDAIPDASAGGDLDADGTVDYPSGGTDWWLNATIPTTFPAPYAGRPVSVYVGPVQRPYHARDDILRVFADLDNASASGYAVGGLGADRMVELAGMSGAVRSAGVFAFAGTFPGQWSWVRTGDTSFAVGFNRTEFASPENLTLAGSRMYVEIAEPTGGRDAHDAGTRGTRGGTVAAASPGGASSFDAAPLPTHAARDARGGTRASTLVDGSSNAITTVYNHQRKVVRAGDVPVDGACDLTNSDGCWYAVFYDQSVEATSNTQASTETITKGSWVSGAFPTNIQTENAAYIQYREGAEVPKAEIGYRSTTSSGVNFPKNRTWDGSSWGGPTELSTSGSPVRSVRMAWSPTMVDTRIIVTHGDDGRLDAYVCTTTCTVTNDIGQTAAPTASEIRFDIAYEYLSGEALLVYGVASTDTARDIAYKTYVSGSWGAEQYLDDAGHGTDVTYSLIKLASRPGSDQIGLIGGDATNSDVNAWIWDGSSTWGSYTEITGAPEGVDKEQVAIAWETNSGHLLAVAAEAGTPDQLRSKEYTTSWSSSVAYAFANLDPMERLSLKPNPLSTANDMVIAGSSDGDDMGTAYWTGAAWANGISHETDPDNGGRSFDFAWEPTGSKGLLLWGCNFCAAGQIRRNTFTAPSTWGVEATATMGTNAHPWIQLRTRPPSTGTNLILGAVLETTANDLGGIRWDGTTFTVIGATTFTADTGTSASECFELEYQAAAAHRLQVQYDFSAVPAGDSYTLQIKGYRQDENIFVQVLTSPTWNNRLLITATSNTMYTYTLTTAEYAGGAPAVRFVDADPTDGTQSDFFIDFANVATISHWDRVMLMRSTDTSGSAWGSQVILASGRAGDSALLLARDSAEPSIAIDSGGFLHVVWVAASAAGNQATLNLVRHTRTTAAYPTQAEIASGANWDAITTMAEPGFMPTISTDSNNAPHVAWSDSKTSGTVYYKNKVGGAWKPTVSWGTTYAGLSVDVSPVNNYVSLASTTGAWYGSGWQFRKKITIDYTKVGESVTNFPVLISRTDTSLQSSAQADGDDILFTASDGTTKLSHEIERYTSGTGELVAFVKAPSVSSTTDTVLYMYYGNPAATNQQDTANVWTSSFQGVWHLKETVADEGTVADIYLDSTSNAYHGDQKGTDDVVGKIGNGQTFDGTNDWIDLQSTSLVRNTGAATLGIWINVGALPSSDKALLSTSINNGGTPTQMSRAAVHLKNAGYIIGYGRAPDSQGVQREDTTSAISAGQWHYVSVVIDYANDDFLIYVDGVLQTTTGTPVFTNPVTDNTVSAAGAIGAEDDGTTAWLAGNLDEARVASVARTAGWISTEYNNQNAPATFYAVSGEESPFEVHYTVCKNLAGNNCDAAAEFTKWDGNAGFDPVASTAAVATVQSVTPTSFPTDSTTHNVQLPATVDADDLLIAFVAFAGVSNVTTPSGWTSFFGWNDCSGAASKFKMAAKAADGTEDGTTVNFVSTVAEKAASQVYRITGWRNSGTITNDVEYANAQNCATNANPDAPALNPTNWDVENTLWLTAFGADDDHDATVYPTGYTGGTFTESDASATSASMGSARRNLAAASENPGPFTVAAATWWTATTVGVRPAGTPTTPRYASLATTFEANGDLWIAYEKDVHGTTRAIYARYLDYPAGGWQSPTTVDYLGGAILARPSIGIDWNNDAHALYAATGALQVYYSKRTGGNWGARTAVEQASSDNPTLIVRAPDATYGSDVGGLYWKTSSSETYFFFQAVGIPEFEVLAIPILGILVLMLWRRRTHRTRRSPSDEGV